MGTLKEKEYRKVTNETLDDRKLVGVRTQKEKKPIQEPTTVSWIREGDGIEMFGVEI